MRDYLEKATNWLVTATTAIALTVCSIGVSSIFSMKVNSKSSMLAYEITGCDKFLKTNQEICSVELGPFPDINAHLKFKTEAHKGAFWLGFSLYNHLECKKLVMNKNEDRGNSPNSMFHKYFLKDIDIGVGSLNRPKDAPYALAYLAGEGLFYELNDNFDKKQVCAFLLEAVGPSGKIAQWIKRY